ncbi:Anaerobic sulfatase-maturating enzyme [Luteitalea pratensis]|uniref:Anaerobic sulfatase-maturating enzyme n=1 Tax=Luteitalea pratensis TaxID=1855912 RepID=A0A143PVH7_LUTPR|nr:radical SAM protein [Luteitalea pratensis]AMY12757.1 Anaerobic sulfatase-maturating enzyme [Luteitalea pratensis]
MRASRFTVSVPLPDTGEHFLFNSLTDAQIVVSDDVVQLIGRVDRDEAAHLDPAAREAVSELTALGFIVDSRDAEDRALETFFTDLRDDASHLRVTLLTTLQCNFACDYCIQGDHEAHATPAARMSLEQAAQVGDWMEQRLDALGPPRFTLTFFGGEPLLNLPVVYALAERMWDACRSRGVAMNISIITNGLLLTEAVVDRLLPYGLTGVKITLDGDRATHDRLRPLRGGQGTFDRILANMRVVAPKVRLSIGGNFDVESAASYPELLALLRNEPFADRIAKIAFKPIIRGPNTGRAGAGTVVRSTADGGRVIPLMAVDSRQVALGGTCMTAAGSGAGSGTPCDTCGLADERMSWLRAETRASGFATLDGLHMGPCELHRRHSYTVGPEGSLYPCPGFTGEPGQRIGHVVPALDPAHHAVRDRFEAHAPWRACGDCALVPVCGGGCSVAAHNEQGDLNAPSCHRPGMLVALGEIASAAASVPA